MESPSTHAQFRALGNKLLLVEVRAFRPHDGGTSQLPVNQSCHGDGVGGPSRSFFRSKKVMFFKLIHLKFGRSQFRSVCLSAVAGGMKKDDDSIDLDIGDALMHHGIDIVFVTRKNKSSLRFLLPIFHPGVYLCYICCVYIVLGCTVGQWYNLQMCVCSNVDPRQ